MLTGCRPYSHFDNFSMQGSSPQKSKEICLMFNKFKSSTCELPNNQCANHCLHKCSFCHRWGCKACNHRANGPGHFNKSKGQKYQGHAHVVSNPSLSGQGSGNGDESRSSSSPSEPTSNPELTTVLSNMQQSLQNLSVHMEKLERPLNPIALVASHVPSGAVSGTDILKQAPAYSCPAVTAIPSHLSISDLDLANKHILWAPITSAGVALPLPLDSCCSLSLVSKAHAEVIISPDSMCEIINSTLGMLIHRWIGDTLFCTCITLKSKQRESGASESPCFSQMHSEMRLSMFLQKEMT